MKLRSIMAGAVALGLTVGAAHAEKLIYSTHTPATYSDNTYVAKRFFDRITEATGGDQTFDIAAGGVLASGSSALEAVQSRAVETTILVYGYTPSDLPVLTMLGDLYSVDARVAGAATTETMLKDCPQCLQEMKDRNIVVLQNTSSTAYNLLCPKVEIRSLEDLKGKKVRAVGSFAELAQHLGAVPVNITVQEIYEALQRGQVDCAMNDAGQLEGLQLWDIVKYVTDVRLGTFQSIGFVVVNRDVWDGFSDEQREVWIDSASQSVADYAYSYMDRVKNAVATAKGKSGLEIIEPDAALSEAVSEYRENEIPSIIEIATGRGVENAAAIADAFVENTAKWTKIVNEIGEGEWGDAEWEAFAAAIHKEIYEGYSFD